MIQIDRCFFTDKVPNDPSNNLYFLLLPIFSCHTSRVWLKRKYFSHEKKKLLFCIQQKLKCPVQYNKMAAKAKVRLKLLDVFDDFNNFVDGMVQYIDK